MLAGVGQPLVLLLQPLWATIVVGAALAGGRIIHIQVDEDVGLAEALPHVGDQGMFLGGLADQIAEGG